MIKTDCLREDCRFRSLGGFTTAMAWSPEYDKNGKLLNHDPNTQTWRYDCITCGKKYLETIKDGKTIVEELRSK